MKPERTPIYCSVCGILMGVTYKSNLPLSYICCGDPLCRYQVPAGLEDTRNGQISALLMDGVPAPKVAAAYGKTRQRMYQILNSWKVGR